MLIVVDMVVKRCEIDKWQSHYIELRFSKIPSKSKL